MPAEGSGGAVEGDGRLKYLYRAEDDLPGGVQALGNNLLIGRSAGEKGYVDIYDLSAPGAGTVKTVAIGSKAEFQANETYLLENFLAEDHPHHLRVHTGWSLFPASEAQQIISPKALAYQAFSYQYANALSWGDLGLSFALFSPGSANVRVQGTRVGEPVEATEARQTLKGYRVDFKWMWNQRLRLGLGDNRRWQTLWITALGPSYIELERSLNRYAFRDRSRSLGFHLEQGLEVYWKFRHVSWNILAQYALFDNQWTASNAPVALVSISSGVGLAF